MNVVDVPIFSVELAETVRAAAALFEVGIDDVGAGGDDINEIGTVRDLLRRPIGGDVPRAGAAVPVDVVGHKAAVGDLEDGAVAVGPRGGLRAKQVTFGVGGQASDLVGDISQNNWRGRIAGGGFCEFEYRGFGGAEQVAIGINEQSAHVEACRRSH